LKLKPWNQWSVRVLETLHITWIYLAHHEKELQVRSAHHLLNHSVVDPPFASFFSQDFPQFPLSLPRLSSSSPRRRLASLSDAPGTPGSAGRRSGSGSRRAKGEDPAARLAQALELGSSAGWTLGWGAYNLVNGIGFACFFCTDFPKILSRGSRFDPYFISYVPKRADLNVK